MSEFLHWFTSPEWAQIVKALLHSLWQGAVVALVLAVLLRRLHGPVARYRSSLAALATMVFATIVTWAVMDTAEHRLSAPIKSNASNSSEVRQSSSPESAQNSENPVVVVVNRNAAAIRWTAWLALIWSGGAMLMLARAGVKVAGAGRLRRSCRPLTDASIETLVAETRRALGIARQIRVGVTDKLTSPAVVGVIVPMLILPVSLLTTLSPEQIRFVLLHELAHIRRGDYLVNLFQFFAESLFFFNPAVWWISHQIRREREACCDSLATELSGDPADYARTLVRVAEQVIISPPAAAAAFGDKHGPSSLAERVQRLLVPGFRPSLRLTWRAMLAALVFGTLLLFLSAIGTRMTVAAILTPQQRIAEIKKKAVEYGALPEGNPPHRMQQVTVTAHLRTPDGSSLPQKRQATVYSHARSSSTISAVSLKDDGTITYDSSPQGEIWVEAYADGFAPAVVGPFDATRTNRVDAGEIILDRGFEIPLRIVDAHSGAAISNALLRAQYWLRDTGSSLMEPLDLQSDAGGRVVLPHCVNQPLTLVINAPGHEITDVRFESLHAGQTLNLQLKPGAQIDGSVTDKTTGQPISGATVRMIYRKGTTTGHYEWNDSLRLLATTGSDGRFSANQLQPAAVYCLGISAPGHESVLLDNQPPGQRDLRVQLGPELVVRGEVTGDVKGLQLIDNHYVFDLAYSEMIDNGSWGERAWVYLQEENGKMHFQFTNRWAGPIELTTLDGHSFKRDVNAPIDDWKIDLDEPVKVAFATNIPTREVIFRFKDPSGALPQGTVSINVPDSLDPKHLTAHSEMLEITNGEVRAQIAIGGRTSVESEHMMGYWFDRYGINNNLGSIQVSNGAGPMVVEFPVIPAGAIYAKARNADGTSAGGLFFGVEELKRAPGRTDNTPLDNAGDSISDNLPHKWVSGPLPLGGTYRITGWRGNSFCASKPITLTGENPTAEVELQFAPTKALEGTLLDANGRPVPNANLQPSFTLAQDSSFNLDSIFTDAEGRFRIENLTPGPGEYTIEVHAPGIMAERVKLDFNTQPQTIRVKPGRKIAGRLVEAGSNYIIPGAEIRAVDLENPKLPTLTTHTDADGHFEFTEMADANYVLYTDGVQSDLQKTYRAGVATNITVSVKLYEWSTLKPKAPSQAAAREKAIVPPNQNDQRPIVEIKARFIEVDAIRDQSNHIRAIDSEFTEALRNVLTNNPTLASNSPALVVGTLSQAKMSSVLKILQKTPKALLNEGQVTTLSGRQAQLQIVDVTTVVNGLKLAVTNNQRHFEYQTTNMDFGTVLDVVPEVVPGEQSVSLRLIPSVTEFLGYEAPKDFFKQNKEFSHYDKEMKGAQWPIPKFRVRKASANTTVLDGQTLVLGNLGDDVLVQQPDGATKHQSFSSSSYKQLFVFITTRIVDRTGKPIYPENQISEISER